MPIVTISTEQDAATSCSVVCLALMSIQIRAKQPISTFTHQEWLMLVENVVNHLTNALDPHQAGSNRVVEYRQVAISCVRALYDPK
jgi:hypothetical protein